MRHILLTNDDGVDSPGLAAMAAALSALGRLSVIAPDRNRSGIGRGITIHSPLHVEEAGLSDGRPGLATDGTPVDCVRFAALGLFDEPPDVIVSGINVVKRHMRPRGPQQPGGIIEREAPIPLANVRPLCPSCNKPVRVGFRVLADGRKVRYCKKCDANFD